MPKPSDLAEVFAARLAELRQARGLSQRTLGEQMGLTKKQGSSRINRYESGQGFATAANLESLARVLDAPAASLLADSPEMAVAIELFGDFSRNDQARLLVALSVLASAPHELAALIRRGLSTGLLAPQLASVEDESPLQRAQRAGRWTKLLARTLSPKDAGS